MTFRPRPLITFVTVVLILLVVAYTIGPSLGDIRAAKKTILENEDIALRSLRPDELFDSKMVNGLAHGEIMQVPATELCGWQKSASDLLYTERPDRWIDGRAPDEYVAAARPGEGTCDGTPIAPVLYVLLKTTIAPSQHTIVQIEFRSGAKFDRLDVQMSRSSNDGRVSFNAKEHWSGTRQSVANASFFLVDAPKSLNDDGTTLIRLEALHVDAPSSSRWTGGASVTAGPSIRSIAFVTAPKEVRTLRAGVSPATKLQPLLLSPCIHVVGAGEWRPIVPAFNTPCPAGAQLRNPIKQFVAVLLGGAQLARREGVEVGGLRVDLSTFGEPQIVASLPQVWAVCWLFIAAATVFLLTRWVLSRDVRGRVERLTLAIESARATNDVSGFEAFADDKKLSKVAQAAAISVNAEHIQKELAYKAEFAQRVAENMHEQLQREKTLEEQRAKAIEDTIYCLKHELRNFVAAVSFHSDNQELRERANLARNLIGVIERFSAGEDSGRFVTEKDFVPTGTHELLERWLSQCDPAVLTDVCRDDDEVAKSRVVSCVPSLVYQVLDKYLENAIEHRDPPSSKIRLGLVVDAGFAGIYLANAKPDMDAEQAERLFRLLSSQQRRTTAGRSRGFGLYAAQNYASQTGGYASALAMDGGVRFVLFLQEYMPPLSKDSTDLAHLSGES